MTSRRIYIALIREAFIVTFWLLIILLAKDLAWIISSPKFCSRTVVSTFTTPEPSTGHKSTLIVCNGYQKKFNIWFAVIYGGWLGGYVLTMIFFLVVEKTRWPSSIYKTKILPDSLQPNFEIGVAWHIVKVWFLYGPLLILLNTALAMYFKLPLQFGIQRYLASTVVLQHFPGLLSYYIHKLMHWGPLYTRCHKMHHAHVYPSTLSAAYVSWGEMLVHQSFVLIVVALCQTDLISNLIHVTMAGFNEVTQHAGYDTSWASNPKHHLIHHLVPSKNFGYEPRIDEKHGTIQLEFPSWVSTVSDRPGMKED